MENLDKNIKIAGIYFDLSKAFDSINHVLLIEKLANYGIRGICSNLLEFYLQNRRQAVCVTQNTESYISRPRDISQGIPQESILGPLLFLVYVNELAERLNGKMGCQYADDTSVVLADLSENALSAACSFAIQDMENWCSDNCLKLNLQKNALINFSKSKPNYSLYVPSHGKATPVSESIKFLGATMDSQFGWEINCQILVSRLCSGCALLRRLRDVLTNQSIRTYYLSCIQSLITCTVLFWGASSSSASVFVAQKRIIRVIFNLKHRTSCRPYFDRLDVLTAPSLYFFSLVMFMRKNPYLFPKNRDHYALGM